MALKTSVRVSTTRGSLQALRKALKPSNSKVIRTGWWGDYHDSGIPMSQIAAWNHEGHMNGGMFAGTYTPGRPFGTHGWLPMMRKRMTILGDDVQQVLDGTSSWTSFYNSLGESSAQYMKYAIEDWTTPANTEATIGLKGFNDPLIESGSMKNTVKWKVVGKGEGG